MTPRPELWKRTALATLVTTAGLATAAWAASGADPDPAPQPPPAATVIADVDSSPAAIDRAVRLTADRTEVAPGQIVVHRTGSALQATADVTELAATHPIAITAVGADARAALRQAAESELAPSTAWLTAR